MIKWIIFSKKLYHTNVCLELGWFKIWICARTMLVVPAIYVLELAGTVKQISW